MEIVQKWSYFDHMSPHWDLYHDSKTVFSQDALAHDDASLHQVWLHNFKLFRWYCLDKNLSAEPLLWPWPLQSNLFRTNSHLWWCTSENVWYGKDHKLEDIITKVRLDYCENLGSKRKHKKNHAIMGDKIESFILITWALFVMLSF